MRIKIIIEYDGREFNGWQEQEGLSTIQGTIADAIFDLTKQRVDVVGSGRTDAGVSAKNQVAHFDVDTELSAERMKMALNMRLPETIRIKSAEIVSEEFHARFSARRKTYSYHMYASSVQSPLRRHTHLQVWPNLNFDAMAEACQHFVGEHDFKAFCQENPQVHSTVRTIYSCQMTKVEDDITITICGDGFLHNMVRIICGTILKIGQGKIQLENLDDIIESKDRSRAGQTLSPIGLILENVEYTDEI